MSLVLYYSIYCNHSNNLIKKISHISLTHKIDFICIDKKKIQNNKTYIILDNGQEILLPSAIQKVPALLLIDNLKSQIFYGDDIINYLNPPKVENTREDIKKILEPETFTFCGNNLSSISSDSFSFLNSENSENQKNNYVNVNYNNEMKQIQQNYDPSNTEKKINQADIDKYIQQRDNDIKTSDNKILQNI
jgi:hypothetical protein